MAIYDMVSEIEPHYCLVAEGIDGLEGFARTEEADGILYLRPVVVSPESQGQGIGSGLIKHLLGLFPSLTVVARGTAAGFYTKLGFQPIEWDEVYLPFRRECTTCPDFMKCEPIPMAYEPLPNITPHEHYAVITSDR